MVNLSSLVLLGCLAFATHLDPPRSSADEPAAVDPARSALGKGHFNWYDQNADSIREVALRNNEPAPAPGPRSNRSVGTFGFFGNMIGMILFGVGLAALIGLLVWFWKIYEPVGGEAPRPKTKAGEPSRIDSLPEGMDDEFANSDPWHEALRRKSRGDFSGAIICLFAHQLLTLSRLGLVRLAPGRTGRQLVRAVTDADLRTLVNPTLGLFEVVYYGHRDATESEFADLWTRAEAFERRVAEGVAP